MTEPSVAIVTHEYPPYLIGGVGSYCYDLSRFLSNRGIAVTVFCGKSPKPTYEQVDDRLTVVRLPIRDIPLRAYSFQVSNYAFLRKKLTDFTIVHLQVPYTAGLALIVDESTSRLVTTSHWLPDANASAFFNTPIYAWSWQELVSNIIETPIQKTLSNLSLRKTSKAIMVSHYLLHEHQSSSRISDRKYVVIPNGIDFERIERIRRIFEREEKSTQRTILFYGRLTAVKGVYHFINALARLGLEHSCVGAKVIGKGPASGNIRSMTKKLGLDKRVEFVGYLPNHDDLILEIMRSSIVVLPSSFEASSVAVLEAMACGKPVVAFDHPFTREFIENTRSGLLATPGDTIDLARKIKSLLDDENMRCTLGLNALNRAYSEYNWNTLVDKYLDVYREVAESPRAH